MYSQIYSWIFKLCSGIFILLMLAGSIIFPIEASKTKCGFKLLETSINMKKFNGTVINSTITENIIETDDKILSPLNPIDVPEFTCTNIIKITNINHTCNLIVYDGESILNCIESIFPNGNILEIFIEGLSDNCYLHNLSRDCNKSNIYSIFGLVCIIIMIIIIGIIYCVLYQSMREYHDDVDHTLYYRKRRYSEIL